MLLKFLCNDSIPHHCESLSLFKTPELKPLSFWRNSYTETHCDEETGKGSHCSPTSDYATLAFRAAASSLERKGPKPHGLESSFPATEIDAQTLNLPTELSFYAGKVALCGRSGPLGGCNTFTRVATHVQVYLWNHGSASELEVAATPVTEPGPCKV